MTDFGDIGAALEGSGLSVVGAFHPEAEHLAPKGIATLILLGPGGPEMWAAFGTSVEASDGLANPMDRWSARVIGALADQLGAQAFFPFGGPPWQPFQRWAVAGEGAVSSPVGMQATAGRGLWASYRGALGFAHRLELPAMDHASPCAPCPAPCRTACPVDAFADGSYDIARCASHLQTEAGAPCLDGCLVRRACPAGTSLNLPVGQRRFHMEAFLRARRQE